MDKCKAHPLSFAIGRCKKCYAPVCDKCKIQTKEGLFCSEECVSEFQHFQSRISNYTGVRSGFSFLGFIKSTMIAGFLIVVIYGVLVFWLKTSDPGEMWTALLKQFKVIAR